MPGETTHFKIKYAQAADETKAFPAEVSQPQAEKIDETLFTRTVLVESGANSPNFLSWGAVISSGSIESGSGDYTVTKTGTGIYKVKWKTAKSVLNYAFTVTGWGEAVLATAVTINTTEVVLMTFKKGTVTPEDNNFTFICVAPS